MPEHVFDSDPRVLVGVASALYETWRKTLLSLAEAHGNETGEWLDQLESDALNSIKNTHTEGVSLDVEARAVAAGLEVVAAQFAELRAALEAHMKSNRAP